MKNHERKHRLLLSRKNVEEYQHSIQFLRDSIEKKCPSLFQQPYKLRYNVMSDQNNQITPKTFDSDNEVKSVTNSGIPIQLYV